MQHFGGFIYYLSSHTAAKISLPLLTCLLLTATMSSTDSASVFNLFRLQKMNLKENLRPMLELRGNGYLAVEGDKLLYISENPKKEG